MYYVCITSQPVAKTSENFFKFFKIEDAIFVEVEQLIKALQVLELVVPYLESILEYQSNF